eukprot:TRINITY_DN5482_c0_g4_i1.p1 TRINITY_DN5482_c0_g4~~TRINITY_DN5482_c0_g4_i1.p1  ORF type:complete len:479 (+),score=84.01 TRINITY_DN5482_c0_g4_i1:82-1518(+)
MALSGVSFSIAGNLTQRAQSEIVTLITSNRGIYHDNVASNTNFVISSEEMVSVLQNPYKLQFMPELEKQIQTAQMYGIPIVDPEFLDKCIEAKRKVDHKAFIISGFNVDVESKFKVNTTSSSDLDPSVQEVVNMLFDQKEMSRSLIDLGLDVRKMSLITEAKIKDAFKVLKEIEENLQPTATQTPQQHQTRLRQISDKFYSLIPTTDTSAIKSIEAIKEKSSLLATLTDIEIAQRLMQQKGDDLNMNPIDINYRKLRTKITPLEHYRAEYSMIKTMVENTQSGEFPFRVEIEDVFEIEREGERERFKEYARLPHHRLLWHGSRLTNYIGILSQGLRIAPPEAPVTGYFLGKGIYFGDMVSVSAQYCHATKDQPYGFLLLADTALGRAFQLAHGKYISKEDLDGAGFHSVKCWGTKGPDSGYDIISSDGLIVSTGKESKTGVPVSELIHNEIVLYDVAQVLLRYLVKVKFTFVEKQYYA